MLLLVDNYDSFTYNLVHALSHEKVEVVRQEYALERVKCENFTLLLLGPGPGSPSEASVCFELIERYGGRVPILGVCLGHQCMVEYFGGRVERGRPMHGKRSKILHDKKGVFRGIPQGVEMTRYHSLVATKVPECLEISATTPQGEVMGVRHKELPIEGVQFHPESVVSEWGDILLGNFRVENHLPNNTRAPQGC